VQYAFEVNTEYRFDRATSFVSRDTIAHFDILKLHEGLQPGDSLQLRFEVENIPNTVVRKNSGVEENGTFITSLIYPSLGYRPSYSNAPPTDSPALRNHHRSFDSDYITFETTISTAADQIAIAPGYLQAEWTENGRRYFQYKSAGKVTNDYAFLSGRYQITHESWNGIDLEIYYHKGHEYNVDHLRRGLKAALAYNEKYFSPYQHQQARIIEYSRTLGNFAQSFANTIPYSEVNFMLDIDDAEAGGLNLPFLGAAHELSHQWWGHQVLPADVLGAKMITESMAEYVSLKALEHEYGQTALR
jgi:ABC-2 type transport system permease protein